MSVEQRRLALILIREQFGDVAGKVGGWVLVCVPPPTHAHTRTHARAHTHARTRAHARTHALTHAQGRTPHLTHERASGHAPRFAHPPRTTPPHAATPQRQARALPHTRRTHSTSPPHGHSRTRGRVRFHAGTHHEQHRPRAWAIDVTDVVWVASPSDRGCSVPL